MWNDSDANSNTTLIYKLLSGLVQSASVGLAGILIKDGLLPSAAQNNFVAAILLTFGIGWMAFQKYGHQLLEQQHAQLQNKVAAQTFPNTSAHLFFFPVALAAFLMFASNAKALDLLKAPAPSLPVCSVNYCNGWLVSAALSGVGSNIDVIGQGIQNSVFAGGEIPQIGGGYIRWDGKFLVRASAYLGWQANTNGAVAGRPFDANGFFAAEYVDLGGQLSQLVGGVSNSPVIPSALQNNVMAEFVRLGSVQRTWGTSGVTGAGVMLNVGPNDFVDLVYTLIGQPNGSNGNSNVKQENLITFSWNHVF